MIYSYFYCRIKSKQDYKSYFKMGWDVWSQSFMQSKPILKNFVLVNTRFKPIFVNWLVVSISSADPW